MVPAAQATRLSAVEVDRSRSAPRRVPSGTVPTLTSCSSSPPIMLTRSRATAPCRRSSPPSPADLYQDPLLILVPALFIPAPVMTLRLFPFIMRGLDFIANLIPWATPRTALRQRWSPQPHLHQSPSARHRLAGPGRLYAVDGSQPRPMVDRSHLLRDRSRLSLQCHAALSRRHLPYHRHHRRMDPAARELHGCARHRRGDARG